MMEIKMNKRGVEQPQVIVYVLFTVVLTLSGIYVGFTYLGAVNVGFEFQDYASRLNIATSKILHSADCYAVESRYRAPTGTFFQIESGTVDWAKFSSNIRISPQCLSRQEKQAFARLQPLAGGPPAEVWSCPVPLEENCAKPTKEQLVNEWSPAERNLLVLIQNGTSTQFGRLTVRLKE